MIEAYNIKKTDPLWKYSNPITAQNKAYSYLGSDATLYKSTREGKKYMVKNPQGRWVHFGQLGYEDFNKHKSRLRRRAYLNRATKITGDWKKDKYSPNNLSINILW